jgi:hypothetical protein
VGHRGGMDVSCRRAERVGVERLMEGAEDRAQTNELARGVGSEGVGGLSVVGPVTRLVLCLPTARTLSLSARGRGDADLNSLKERSSTSRCGMLMFRGRSAVAKGDPNVSKWDGISQRIRCSAAHEVRVWCQGLVSLRHHQLA